MSRPKKCRTGKRMLSRIEADRLLLTPKLAIGGVYRCGFCKRWHRTSKEQV